MNMPVVISMEVAEQIMKDTPGGRHIFPPFCWLEKAIESAKRPLIQIPMEPPEPIPVTQPTELRDWFAGMALSVLLKSARDPQNFIDGSCGGAYMIADMMLDEREKEK